MNLAIHSELKSLIWQMTKWLCIAAVILGFISGLSIGIATYENTVTPQGIVVHHSALPPEYQINKPEDVRIISDFHRERGFSVFYRGKHYNIGYHYVILPDGTIVEGRPERCRGAHAKNFNSYLGIVLIGNFSEQNENGVNKTPTAEQMRSLVNLTKEIRARYQIPFENIIPHRNVKSDTECPGKNFPLNDFLTLVSD